MNQNPAQSEALNDPLAGKDGTAWDKPAPSGPPGAPAAKKIPAHLLNVFRFFEGIIADESLVLDMCVSRVVGILEQTYRERAHGQDYFAGEQPTAMHFVMAAGPLAVELYKQTLAAIDEERDKYEKLLEAAQKELREGPSRIVLPT